LPEAITELVTLFQSTVPRFEGRGASSQTWKVGLEEVSFEPASRRSFSVDEASSAGDASFAGCSLESRKPASRDDSTAFDASTLDRASVDDGASRRSNPPHPVATTHARHVAKTLETRWAGETYLMSIEGLGIGS
jgi:hypothetical protein